MTLSNTFVLMRPLALCGMAAALLASVSAASAQDNIASRPSIVVSGQGQVERAPDAFRASASVEGRGRGQVDALRALAAQQIKIVEGLGKLDGLTQSRVTTNQPKVEPTYAPDCGNSDDGDREDCPITGYVAHTSIQIDASPAARAGDAVSLAAELGARGTRLEAYLLSNDSDLRSEANRAAFLDAQRQAEALAQASGQRIVRVLRVQDPGAGGGYSYAENLDEIVVTGNRVQPAVRLDVAPPPIKTTARLTVVFEIG